MSTITTRSGKGSPLTHAEVDANFNNLNTDKIEDGDSPSFVNVTVSGTVDGRDIAADGTKLDGIEASATADQTGAEIKAAYELEANAFTDAQFTKLAGIETAATADQTAGEIKTAYESNADTNAFTDADHTKLDGIEASADVTDATNVTAAGALMDSELTSEASVKALNQGVATTDSPSFAGLTTTADINFGDNDKAIFGAGSDLQIYHNGTNSHIDDAGDGVLFIRSNEVRLNKYTGEFMLRTFADGAVQLYYDNALKLATTSTGVDVTGTVVSDGLTVDTNTLAVDSTNNRVGIGNTSPANKLEVTGAIVAQGAVTAYTNTGLYLQNKGSSVVDVGAWRSGASVAELSFSTDSGSDAAPVERMRIDSSGNVGIGTTSPAATVDVSGNARGAVVTDNDLSFDLSAGNNFSCTPTGAGTLTFTNHLAGQSGFVWLDNSGGHAISAAGTTKINAADLTTISTAGVYTLAYFDNGTNAYVSVSRSFA